MRLTLMVAGVDLISRLTPQYRITQYGMNKLIFFPG